ncbi:RNA polymerase sigma factor FliA [Pseudidiomarina woesei]|uniref:RNA polymerase, sigma 28 subunit, SigD/FliA/WhiG n=1 Tax=Pseudidiomarina woesei TaxID=1381080 RepID=A0A0K6H9E4_9GAMM|nr:RNA polymerase sigma factor FliA [Pseudidiomarina woesei]CUA87578.1 RNA polymerase, sigma 28 subunit, SigD/FliA/WhiG [Pseudidiomarina woesei]
MYTAEGKFNKNSIIEQYYPLVRRQAFNLKVKLPAGVDVDDLIQAGVEGLLSCVDRFDPDSGVAFSTYAHQRIRGAMIDELRSRDWLPRSVRRSGRELEQTIRRLEQQLGRVPEEREIATELGMELNEYYQLLLDTNNGLVLSYDEVVTDTPNAETNGDEEAEPEAQIGAAELKSLLVQAIDSLPEREKLVMTLYYQEELNLKEIGAVLDVTESRVSQLHSQAIKRIRARVAA